MLVVIVIIVVLASILLPALHGARTQAAIVVAKGDIANMETAIAQFHADWGIYPPSTYTTAAAIPTVRLGRVTIPRDDDLGNSTLASGQPITGNRCLFFFLTSQFEVSRGTGATTTSGPVWDVAQDRMPFPATNPLYDTARALPSSNEYITILNTLGCQVRYTGVNIAQESGSHMSLHEIIDPFGNPYVYYNNDADTSNRAASDDTQGHRPFSYDIFSLGPDGVTAGNDGIDNDADGDDETIDAEETLPLGNLNGTIGDDIHNW